MNYLCYTSPSRDGWRNLATDEYFLNTLGEDDFLLYFYINDNAVIIGRNQNGWKECNLPQMEGDGVQLVRRMSGGGAVYHDEGNLNFSFHTPKDCYDVERQLSVILKAVQDLGIEATFTGRNDLTTIGGQKFSGNAFCSRGNRKLHHGTLLVHANLGKLAGYLNVSQLKIQAKGVSSVRARVCNLQELAPGLTVAQTEQAVRHAYGEVYAPWTDWSPTGAEEEIEELYQRNKTWEWQLGRSAPFSWEGATRFDWGEIQLCLNVKEGRVEEVRLWTDALDIDLPNQVEGLLLGQPFQSEALAAPLEQTKCAPLEALANWLMTQGI